jgi:hypothetical protein
VVVEVADGLLQAETGALFQASHFVRSVDAWLLAATDPLAAVGGVAVLRGWGITPAAISGRVSMSPLGLREVEHATKLPGLSAAQLQAGVPLRGLMTDRVDLSDARVGAASIRQS